MLSMKLTEGNLEGVRDLLTAAGDAAMDIAAAAINDGIDYARKTGGEAILDQVNFPPGYLDLPERFAIIQRATPTAPLARLTARQRPTSLGAFITAVGPKGRGVTVKVQRKGAAKRFNRAFVTNALKAGDNAFGNRGVALRTKGPKPERAYKPVRLFSDDNGVVWLLYGPSVNQVFSDVADDILPKVNRFVADRYRQLFNARFGRG